MPDTVPSQRSTAGHDPTVRRLALLGTLLAIVAAVVYLLIGLELAPDSLETPPQPVMLIAAASYLVGGALILRLNERLLMLGAGLNLLVIVVFAISLALGRSDIEVFGVVSKLAQIGLLGVLVVLARQLSHANAEPGFALAEIDR